MKTLLLLLLLLPLGCAGGTTASGDLPANDAPTPDADATAPVEDVAVPVEDLASPPPVYDPAQWYTYEAGPFTVPAGKERYFCFAHTLPEDMDVDEIVLESRPVVHHVVYSKTGFPDPDGFFECNVLFQDNWIPLFIAGTGDASLKMPEDAGHVFKAGTQLTVQFHLLNATPEDVTETIPLRFHKMAESPKHPVEVVLFGSMGIALPPNQVSDVVSTCNSDSDMTLFSAFPHMHLLGTSMVVETGPDADNLTEVFRRDPFDFDDQTLSDLDLTIQTGDVVRVTCAYDNTLDQIVTFGESTTNEMCFFIGFATDADHQFSGCLGDGGGGEGLGLPEGCGTDPPNELGLGTVCTAGGGECPGALICTEDYQETGEIGVCISIACSEAADCGESGVCCLIPEADGLTICLPPSCVLSFCQVLP